MTALGIRSEFELVVSDVARAFVSIPAIQRAGVTLESPELAEKDLMSAGTVDTSGKYPLEQHLTSLVENHGLDRSAPLLVLGLRNNLVNKRAIVILGGRA